MLLDRRKFLKVSSLALASAITGKPPITAAAETADLVLAGGKLITVDKKDSVAQAVAVKNGRILDVGSDEAIRQYVGQGTKVIDLHGRTVTPGLIDSHAHLPVFGFRENGSWVNLQSKGSKEEILEAIGTRAKKLQKAEWVYAWGIQDITFSFMDRSDLDRVSQDHAILAVHTSGQWGFANTLALQLSGIDRNTPDPEGAKIAKDSAGNPTGLLIHYPALYLVRRKLPVPTYEKYREALSFAANLYAAEGVTTIHDNFFFIAEMSSANPVEAYIDALESNQLPVRVKLWPYIPNIREARLAVEDLFSKKDPDPDSAYRLLAQCKREKGSLFSEIWGGWKLAADGGGPSSLFYRNPSGLPMHDEKDFQEMVSLFHKTGQQISVHAIGDKAVDLTVSAFIQALKAEPRRDHRHRIEHANSPTIKARDLMARSGVVVSTHPQWIYKWFDRAQLLKYLDSDRGAIPLKSYLDRSIPVAFGADPPAFPVYQPQVALWQAVARVTEKGYRLTSSESISIRSALRCQTMGSAYAGFQEKEVGSIEKGKLADLVVWDKDMDAVPTDEIKNLRAEATLLGGKVVYGKL
ncbi:MAG: amidohydrolase [Thermodesulfobacteriota bacterium]